MNGGTPLAESARDRPLLSVVVPCHNEQDVLPSTAERLRAVLSQLPGAYEVIFVDDGSTDHTLNTLRKLQSLHPEFRVLTLSRNFGHQLAVTAGVDHAKGDAIVLIDADLQDPPEVILEMVARWRAGAAVVYGVRVSREGETLFKRLTAALFYRTLDRLSDVRIPLDTGDFRLIDRRVADVLRAMPERDRFIRGLVAWAGFKQEEVRYHRSPRQAGETKYPFGRMVRLALDGVSSFSTKPLRIAVWLGFAAAALAMLGVAYAIAVRLLTQSWVPGWAAIFVAVLFMGGVQLMAIGVIGEYVGRLFMQAKARPLYVVAERIEGARTPDFDTQHLTHERSAHAGPQPN